MPESSGLILIVEDSVQQAQFLQDVLQSYGFQVIGPITSGRKAIATALNANPDLILMDVELEGAIDGIEAAGQIRARRDIPIIYLTAYAGDEILERAKPTGPAGYLVKPFKTQELTTNIEMALYRHKMERKLRESEARFAGILATAKDAIIGASADGAIQLFNESAERMFGYPATAIMGQPLDRLLKSDGRAARWADLRKLAAASQNGQGRQYELAGRRRSGEVFPMEIAVSRYKDNGDKLFIAVVRDISERKRAEEALRRYAAQMEQTNTQLTALSEVALRLQRTRNLDQVLATLGSELHKLGITCVVTRTSPHDAHEQQVYYSSLPPDVLAQTARWLGRDLAGLTVRPPERFVPADPFFVAMFRRDVLDVIPTVDKSTLEAMLDAVGLGPEEPIIGLPLRVGRQLFGTLVLWGSGLDGSKMPTYQIFASQVAIALENARLLEAERAARERSEALREVASILNVSLDVEQVLDLILNHVGRVIAYDTALMMMVAGDRVEVVARRGKSLSRDGRAPQSMAIELLPGIQEVLEGQRPVYIADTRTDPRWVKLVDGTPIRSWMGVPILAEEEIVGILNLNKAEAGYYNADDARLAEAFAGQAKLAIENARLFARTQRHAEELEQRVEVRTRNLKALYDIMAAVGQQQALEPVLERSLHSALKALRAQAGAIHLRENGLEEPFMLVTLAGCDALQLQFATGAPARGAAEAVLAEEAAQVASGRAEDEPYVLAATPMAIHGRNLGVLTLFRCSELPFNADDVTLLCSIGDHMAVAVENAGLRHQAEQAAAAAERERLARELHDSVTQQLYSLSLFAEAVREQARTGEVQEEYTVDISETAQQALREMRLLLYELRAGTFSHDGLVEALRFRLDAVERRAGLLTRLVADPGIHLPLAMEEGLYRIAQEALNNVLKHAQARAVVVYLHLQEATVKMGIIDNGVGFDQSLESGGMGLTTMAERAAKLGAELQIESRLDHGTSIHVVVPRDGHGQEVG